MTVRSGGDVVALPVRGARLPSTTTVWFALLVAMVLATSWTIGFWIAALTDGGVYRAAIEANRCVLGHGYDTYFDNPALRSDDPASEGIRRCVKESEGAEALRSWVIPAGVFAAAGISLWMLPRWRIRRRRLVLTVADLADDAVVADVDEAGVNWPRPLAAGGALVGLVAVSSVC